MQNLRVERRFLTIALMYGIITAEKEFMRSWIFDFSMATISQWNELDHTFDHLASRTTWKQCLQEHPKAPFSDWKAPKNLVNQGKNRCRFVRDVEVASSHTEGITERSVVTLFRPSANVAPRPFWLWEVFLRALFFAYCDANFEGWQLDFCQPSLYIIIPTNWNLSFCNTPNN